MMRFDGIRKTLAFVLAFAMLFTFPIDFTELVNTGTGGYLYLLQLVMQQVAVQLLQVVEV